MTTPGEIIAANDNASDYADAQMEAFSQRAAEDIDYLMREEEGRDLELWTLLSVSEVATLADYDRATREERDLDWTEGLGGLGAASTTQVFLDNRDETIVKPVAYREQVIGSLVVTATALKTAAKRSIDYLPIAKFEPLQAAYIEEFAFLSELSNAELYTVLVENGAMRPVDKLIADQMGYVSRMTDLRPGDPRFAEEVAGLINQNSTTNIASMNRRAVEQIHAQREINGDVNTEMVWIVEGGASTCSYCLARAGMVKSYKEWQLVGMPGAETCKGGDRCRCHLAAL